MALSNIKFIGQLVHSSLDRSRCLLSVRLRTKGRTGIEESEQGQLLNNDLIIAIKEHKERGGCGVKRDFFLNFKDSCASNFLRSRRRLRKQLAAKADNLT